MLSMNSSTSWPPSSRKYSAIVSPERPTRMRAPGGSFICPKTRMVLSSTPDSLISIQRSLPSRVRSPTPQKAESPSCSSAMLRINSWMSTVLPTPAPPNRPTFPPLAYGASRSMTLMPVSKISRVGIRSSTSGAGRWIGQRVSPSTGAPSSMGSPSRLKSRPSVARPTGTVIGPPREAIGPVHGHSAHAVVPEVLLDLADQPPLLAVVLDLELQGVVDLGQGIVGEGGLDHDALHFLDPTDGAPACPVLAPLLPLLLLACLGSCFHSVSFY